MKAWEVLALDDERSNPRLHEIKGGSRSSRAASDDNDWSFLHEKKLLFRDSETLFNTGSIHVDLGRRAL
jgi:hypothetical protein